MTSKEFSKSSRYCSSLDRSSSSVLLCSRISLLQLFVCLFQLHCPIFYPLLELFLIFPERLFRLLQFGYLCVELEVAFRQLMQRFLPEVLVITGGKGNNEKGNYESDD